MKHLSSMNPAQDAARSNILPSAFEHVHNGIAQVVLFPGRAARLLIGTTSLKILGACALLSATAGEKTGTNDWVREKITAPLLTNVGPTDKDVPFPVQATVRLKNKVDDAWRSSFHPDHIHANTPTASISSNPNDPLNKIMRQLSGQGNITIEQFRAAHPEYQK